MCTINGTTGHAAIADMWKASFEKLYSIHDNKDLAELCTFLTPENTYFITQDDLHNAIQQLKCHKSCGPDGIPAEAIKCAGSLLAVHLTLLFNMCLP